MTAPEEKINQTEEWEEIWLLFAQEGKETLNIIEDALLKVETDAGNLKRISKLFRAMHTFKGMARMMGLSTTETLSHCAEDLLGLVRDKDVALTAEMIDLLLAILDQLRQMLKYALTHRTDSPTEQVELLVTHAKNMFDLLSASPNPKEALPLPLPPISKPATAETPSTPLVPVDVDVDLFSAIPADELAHIDFVDPAADPAFVEIFTQLLEESLTHFQVALNALSKGDETAVAQIQNIVNDLDYAVRQMDHQTILTLLENITNAINYSSGEALLAALKQEETALWQELSALKEANDSAAQPWEQIEPGLLGLLNRWRQETISTDLQRLKMVVDSLQQSLASYDTSTRLAPPAEGTKTSDLPQLLVGRQAIYAEETAGLLRSLCHSCLSHKLGRVSRLTLALEDLYARIALQEISINETLITLTYSYIEQLKTAVEAISTNAPVDLDAFEAMLLQCEAILYSHADNKDIQLSRQTLAQLNLPPEFEEAFSPDNLLIAAQAIQHNETFYTILADMGENVELGEKLLAWFHNHAIRIITSATVFQDNRTLFNFLVSSTIEATELQKTLAEVNPAGPSLILNAYTLGAETVPAHPAPTAPVYDPATRLPTTAAGSLNTIQTESLTNFIDNVGELVAVQAALQHTTERLAETDLLDNVTRLIKSAEAEGAYNHQHVKQSLQTWLEDLSLLKQKVTEMGATLGQLHETALALRLKPAAWILDPLRPLVETIARQRGKQITLDIIGAETEIDLTVISLLEHPLKRLVAFAAAHSIEEPDQRIAAGKPASGHISVAVSADSGYSRVEIKDDGRGPNLSHICRRLNELGRAGNADDPPDKLLGNAITEGFGPLGEANQPDGVDLYSLQQHLRSRQGQLTAQLTPGEEMRFIIEVPLSMGVIDGMVARVGNIHYVISVNNIHRIVKPEENAIVPSSADGKQAMLKLNNQLIPIRRLAGDKKDCPLHQYIILVIEQDSELLALCVDKLLGQQQVFIRPLQSYLTQIQGVSGCALLGDGEVGMVLDLRRLNSQNL